MPLGTQPPYAPPRGPSTRGGRWRPPPRSATPPPPPGLTWIPPRGVKSASFVPLCWGLVAPISQTRTAEIFASCPRDKGWPPGLALDIPVLYCILDLPPSILEGVVADPRCRTAQNRLQTQNRVCAFFARQSYFHTRPMRTRDHDRSLHAARHAIRFLSAASSPACQCGRAGASAASPRRTDVYLAPHTCLGRKKASYDGQGSRHEDQSGDLAYLGPAGKAPRRA